MSRFNIYVPIQKTFEERIEAINKGFELWLAVEGRHTNLRIWKSRLYPKVNPDNTEGIFMRLDKANAYSAPLSEKTAKYLVTDNEIINKLSKFTFPTSIDNLQNILDLTKDMSIRRDIVAW